MEPGVEDQQVEASNKYNLEVYDPDSFSIMEDYIFDIKEPKGIHSVKFNYNDQYIAAGYRDSMVRIFNLMTKNMVCELDCSGGNPKENLVQVMKWRPKIEGRTNNILMTACKDTIMEWHTASRQIVHKKTFQDNIIYSMDYSNDGMQYALGFKDYSIRVYDGVTKKEEVKLGGYDNHRVTGHTGKICALKYHKDDPKILLSGGSDGNILIWDLTSGNIIDLINGPSILGEGLDMNSFGEVLSASWKKDDPLQLWDYESKKLKMNIDWNAKEKKEEMKASTQLYCCKFSNDFGKLIFGGGSLINAAKVFEWNGKCLASIDKLSHAVISIDCSNDVTKKEQLLAIGGGEGSIRVFKYRYTPQTN